MTENLRDEAAGVLREHERDFLAGWGCSCGEDFRDRLDFTRPATVSDQFARVFYAHQAQALMPLIEQLCREALVDAAEYMMPGDVVGPDFLIYLAVTKYGRAEFDPAVANNMVKRRLTGRVEESGTDDDLNLD